MKKNKVPLSADYGKERGVLAVYMDWLHDEKGVQRTTAYNYYMALRSLAKFLAHRRKRMDCEPDEVILGEVSARDMLSITKDEWWDYLDYCQFTQCESKGSLAVKISVVRGFYVWLANREGQASPAAHIISTVRPKAKNSEFGFVTEEAENILCEHASGDMALRNVCIIRIFLRCGLGLQEICNLDMEDVELEALRVKTKRGGVRLVPIDAVVAAALNSYIAVRNPATDGSNALFTSATKGRLKRGAVEKMIRKVSVAAGKKTAGVTIRDLQMTAKVRMVQAHGTQGAAQFTNVTSKFYFQKVYRHHAARTSHQSGALLVSQ